jgi:hypothetical protein
MAVALIMLLSTDTGALFAGVFPMAGARLKLRPQASPANPTTSASSGKNPYLWPGVAMMAIGAGLMVYGLHGTGACRVLCAPYQTCRCDTQRNTDAAVAGGVVAAAGVTLLFVGNGKKGSAPVITLRRKGVALGYRLKF